MALSTATASSASRTSSAVSSSSGLASKRIPLASTGERRWIVAYKLHDCLVRLE